MDEHLFNSKDEYQTEQCCPFKYSEQLNMRYNP